MQWLRVGYARTSSPPTVLKKPELRARAHTHTHVNFELPQRVDHMQHPHVRGREGLGHGLLDLNLASDDVERVRMKLYDDTMKFIEAFAPDSRCAAERVRKLRVLQLQAKRLLLLIDH